MQIELDAKERLELASMAYARWSIAFDNVKLAKGATWEQNKQVCPKSDWIDFYNDRLKYALDELELAAKLKDAICKYSPLVIGE